MSSVLLTTNSNGENNVFCHRPIMKYSVRGTLVKLNLLLIKIDYIYNRQYFIHEEEILLLLIPCV